MYEVKKLSLSYSLANQNVQVLKDLNFKVNPGDFIAIQGPSGSGKSTLFNILGFLLKPTSGTVLFDEININDLDDDDLTLIRNQKIGFVFQQFHLLPKATVLENVLLPAKYPSETDVDLGANAKALRLLETVGLSSHLNHFPNQLSGGQQQRVAIARALMNDIDLILADEPTGNLDSQNAKQILDILTELNHSGKTIILITHDAEVAKRCSKVYHLFDGAFTHVVDNFASEGAKNAHATVSKPRFKLPKIYPLALYVKVAQSVLPLAFENLIRNKTKSLLTMMGVIIGVAAVLAMVTLGQYTKSKILQTYESLGVNKLLIRGYPNWRMKATDEISTHFTSFDWENDIVPLKKVFSEIKYISPALNSSGNRATSGGIEAGDNKIGTFGITPEYLEITNREIKLGRNITPYHVENRAPVCLIGYEVAERLFARSNPIGQIITVSNGQSATYPCKVIGVLASTTSNKEWSPPNLHIFVPYTYFQSVSQDWWNSKIREVAIQIYSNQDVVSSGKKIKAYFEQKYGKSGMFFVDSDSTLIAQMKKFLNIFELLLTAIALLSLFVGGIGINNMMLVSVSERLKEFGIRKALGASHKSIRVQVLLESISLCVIAGLIGVLLGFAGYELLIFGATQFVPNLKFEWIFEPVAVFSSLFSIVAVGIASGLVPALKAEKLQVIEALRSD